MLRSGIRYVVLSSHRRPPTPPPHPPVLLVHHHQHRTLFTFRMADSITDGPDQKRARTSELLDGASSFATFAPKQMKKQSKESKAHNKRLNKIVNTQNRGGHEETSHFEIRDLLGERRVTELEAQEKSGGNHWEKANEKWGNRTGKDREGEIVTVKIERLGAYGDGLAVLKDDQTGEKFRVLEVPFTLPGELVKAKIYNHERGYFLSRGQLTEIIEPSPDRALKEGEVVVDVAKISPELEQVRKLHGPRVQCKYFGTCSGCQFQALSYEKQLEIKQTVVRTAFENFANLDPNLLPEIGPTLPSPLQYQYRTKLTPHFSIKQMREPTESLLTDDDHSIGFDRKFLIRGKDKIIDIEECVIATEVINETLALKRKEEKNKIRQGRYKKDSTLLLRHSLEARGKKKQDVTRKAGKAVGAPEKYICVSEHSFVVREKVGSFELEQSAGSFFQNNSSILPSLIDYIAEAVKSERPTSGGGPTQKKYLIDAYCGSGLFAITLAEHFTEVAGVEIDPNSITYAKHNALLNAAPGRVKIKFITGNSELIFRGIQFPPDQTTIIIDPPRKGCHPDFLNQLLDFNPATIIYVSCNVHTQARDIGWLVKESAKRATTTNDATKQIRIESVRAADLFANTHHAEGVAVLRRALI